MDSSVSPQASAVNALIVRNKKRPGSQSESEVENVSASSRYLVDSREGLPVRGSVDSVNQRKMMQSSVVNSSKHSKANVSSKNMSKKEKANNGINYSQYSVMKAYTDSSPAGLCSSICNSELADIYNKGNQEKGNMSSHKVLPFATSRTKTYEWGRSDLSSHLSKLANVKPRVDTSSPKIPLHSVSNFSHTQKLRERQLKESQERITSKHKMMTPKVKSWNTTQSLHMHPLDVYRSREKKKIQGENESLLKRLADATPSFQTNRSSHLLDHSKNRISGLRLRQFPSVQIVLDQEFNPMKKKSKLRPAKLKHIERRVRTV